MNETWAFIDEYGNPNLALEKEGVSQFFVVAAVVVAGSDLLTLRTELEGLRRAVFQTGEMKSKTLGKSLGRWRALLEQVNPLPFKFYGLAVDKRLLLRDSGFQWKQSFYKNLCGRAYGKLLRGLPGLHVRADRYGDTRFKDSFASYIERNHRLDLFDQGTFEFVDSKDDVAVQLADIVAGVLARTYDPGMTLGQSGELLRLLMGHALLVDEWPPRLRLGPSDHLGGDPGEVDGRIEAFSVRKVNEYLEGHDDSTDPEVKCRVAVLERLLMERRFGAGAAVGAAALVGHLRDRGLDPKDENWVRRNVIAPLRDWGALITSSSLGYKLPAARGDLVAFARHADSVCVPMLNRVSAACEAVKLATIGDVDVLEDTDLVSVKNMVLALGAKGPVEEPEEP